MNHPTAALAAAALLIAATAATALAAPPEITNVKASQRPGTKLVDITYDAADADGDTLTIRIEVSNNDGARYSVPAFTLTGDIGAGIVPGTGKHIVWDAGTDWDGEYSDLMRVMVYAVDAQGCPGLEWSDEVPPGGFLLGQDGGAEGSGPSCHVNIPWSYWLSKYEITAQQYCDFLNTAFAARRVALKDFSAVYSISGATYTNFSGSYLLCNVGDFQKIRWNVSTFEVVSNYHHYPADVTWFGAMAFAQFYGYDLPTLAEWEKAARGPDLASQGNHCLYTWGNDRDNAKANFAYDGSNPESQKPVGYYNGSQTPTGPDMPNGYALYDMTGNANEWTRTRTAAASIYMTGANGTNEHDSGTSGMQTESATLPAGAQQAGGTVRHPPIAPGSCIITVADTTTLSDSGNGVLYGPDGDSGTVSYESGAWSIRLRSAWWSIQQPITISYNCSQVITSLGTSFYPSREDLSIYQHQYWESPYSFFSKSGAPIYSNSIQNTSSGEYTTEGFSISDDAVSRSAISGFRVIRRQFPEISDD